LYLLGNEIVLPAIVSRKCSVIYDFLLCLRSTTTQNAQHNHKHLLQLLGNDRFHRTQNMASKWGYFHGQSLVKYFLDLFLNYLNINPTSGLSDYCCVGMIKSWVI
jgi:hypothetical protein